MPKSDSPFEVSAIRNQLNEVLNASDDQGRAVGNATHGVYAFFDYDSEPIYVGQTRESLRTRILRHLTNQRTDAVAMNVLDPFEVADIEMWPLFGLDDLPNGDPSIKETLDSAEFTVFQKVLSESKFDAVLNEKPPVTSETIDLPNSLRLRIIPKEIFESRIHSDIRIARRAITIANLARVISERQVQSGLRRTLLTQARRLETLARERLDELDS